MLLKPLLMAIVAAGTALSGAAAVSADPVPAPAVPDIAAYPPVNPADYTVNGGKWYAFAGPPGVVCILDSLKGEYGCSGPLPGAPAGVNLVSAGPTGVPAFTTTDTPPYAAAGPVKPLPPNTRLSFRQIFCGVDDAGTVACLNTREATGFVVGTSASSIILPPPPPPPPPVEEPVPVPAPVPMP